MAEAKDLLAPAAAANAFRSILDAVAKPALPVALHAPDDAPSPLFPASATVLLSLCDFQSPVWLSEALNTQATRNFIRFHTGAPLLAKPLEAAFAVTEADAFRQVFPLLSRGSDEYPDRSTTLIVQVPEFHAGDRVRAEGPGIQQPREFAVAGVTQDDWRLLIDERAIFPRGVDVLFVSGHAVIALPRSTRISFLESA
jgi:alpha-D-ribose 1-methylphosphonate 5-triphosphate synthase subunit PhnH